MTFHLLVKEVNLMEILQSLAIGVKGIFASSLRKLQVRLSTPVALLFLNSFNIFRVDTEQSFSNGSFFFTEVNSLVILTHWRYFKSSCRVRKLFKLFSLARFSKCFFEGVCDCPGRKCQLFFHVEAYSCRGSLSVWLTHFFIIFQSSFGFPIFSDSLSSKSFLSLTLIWKGFLGVRFDVRGRGVTRCLKLARGMLEIWNLYVKTHPYLVLGDISFSIKTLLILLISAFLCKKIRVKWPK